MAQIPRQFKRNVVFLGLACLIAACTVNPRPVTHEEARKELESLKGPDVKGVSGTMKEEADAAVKAGNLSQGEIFYRQILDKDPANDDVRMAYADILRREDRCADALTNYDNLIAKRKNNAAAMEGKGLCIMAKGDTQAATGVFSEVMKIDPNRWRTLNAIGILFATKGMTKEALAYYDEALKYNPSAASVLNNIGLTYALSKNYDEAIKAFQKAQTQAPQGSPNARRVALNLALVYGLAGKMDEAQKTAEPYLSKAALYNNLGLYAHLSKDDALAKSYLNMALSNSTVYYERAWNNLQDIGGELDSKSRGGVPESQK